ncbi:hypothetical protein KQI89_17425 [Clostridium sp. MSJ-4]|uniref:Uncharacterized protein n=1 Tax=Clostridium simiarum TaxID=2841506 RepID=A0ABS6F4R0_9CLOT|nr:hypothetical protein [Clostridium simiarum]MBU5593517.1 hypothetical protein [Clostridium simiarum]
MNYHFGFSWTGFIIFLLPMIPNVFYFLIPTSGNNVNRHLILDVLEHGSQAIFIFLLIFVIRKQTSEILCAYTIAMAIILIFYYVLWIFYFIGKVNLLILLGMAVLPVAYFILAEMWLHNYLAIIPTVIFGIVHVIITYMDFKLKH